MSEVKREPVKKKLFKGIAFLGAGLWMLSGVITIGSILNGTVGFFINIVVGVIFILIGVYVLTKAVYFLKLLAEVRSLESNDRHKTDIGIYRINVRLEILLMLSFVLSGLIILSAVISRTFYEGFPVFG